MAKRKKRSIIRSLIKLLILLLILCIGGYYSRQCVTRPSSVLYPEFGIDIPLNYPLHGIDVSRYQGIIDWEDLSAMKVNNIQISFAYIKATEGIDLVDEQYRRNWFEAEDHGIVKGAYHYFIAGESGKQHAKNFIAIARLKKGDLPPVLDIEEARGTSLAAIQREIKDWINVVENHYHVTPLLYSNIDFYNTYIRDAFSTYPFWIAHYLQPGKPRIKGWSIWQHSEKGHVNGIKTNVDFNVFSGDSIAFRELLLK